MTILQSVIIKKIRNKKYQRKLDHKNKLNIKVKESIDSYIQICAMVGKFGIAGSFALIYNYTAELYPVVVRSNGVGIGSIAGRFGGILFPFVLDLKGKVNNGHGEYLPLAIFGSLAIGK